MEIVESTTQSSLLNTFFCLSGFQSSVLLFTSDTGRIADHTEPKYGKIPYVTLHFLDWRVAASRRHINRAATTVLVCEPFDEG